MGVLSNRPYTAEEMERLGEHWTVSRMLPSKYTCTDCRIVFESSAPYVLGPHSCDEPDCELTGQQEQLCPQCAAEEMARLAR